MFGSDARQEGVFVASALSVSAFQLDGFDYTEVASLQDVADVGEPVYVCFGKGRRREPLILGSVSGRGRRELPYSPFYNPAAVLPSIWSQASGDPGKRFQAVTFASTENAWSTLGTDEVFSYAPTMGVSSAGYRPLGSVIDGAGRLVVVSPMQSAVSFAVDRLRVRWLDISDTSETSYTEVKTCDIDLTSLSVDSGHQTILGISNAFVESEALHIVPYVNPYASTSRTTAPLFVVRWDGGAGDPVVTESSLAIASTAKTLNNFAVRASRAISAADEFVRGYGYNPSTRTWAALWTADTTASDVPDAGYTVSNWPGQQGTIFIASSGINQGPAWGENNWLMLGNASKMSGGIVLAASGFQSAYHPDTDFKESRLLDIRLHQDTGAATLTQIGDTWISQPGSTLHLASIMDPWTEYLDPHTELPNTKTASWEYLGLVGINGHIMVDRNAITEDGPLLQDLNSQRIPLNPPEKLGNDRLVQVPLPVLRSNLMPPTLDRAHWHGNETPFSPFTNTEAVMQVSFDHGRSRSNDGYEYAAALLGRTVYIPGRVTKFQDLPQGYYVNHELDSTVYATRSDAEGSLYANPPYGAGVFGHLKHYSWHEPRCIAAYRTVLMARNQNGTWNIVEVSRSFSGAKFPNPADPSNRAADLTVAEELHDPQQVWVPGRKVESAGYECALCLRDDRPTWEETPRVILESRHHENLGLKVAWDTLMPLDVVSADVTDGTDVDGNPVYLARAGELAWRPVRAEFKVAYKGEDIDHCEPYVIVAVDSKHYDGVQKRSDCTILKLTADGNGFEWQASNTTVGVEELLSMAFDAQQLLYSVVDSGEIKIKRLK